MQNQTEPMIPFKIPNPIYKVRQTIKGYGKYQPHRLERDQHITEQALTTFLGDEQDRTNKLIQQEKVISVIKTDGADILTQEGLKERYETQSQKIKGPQLNLPLTNYLENAKVFWESNPYFYDKIGVFWFWDHETHRYNQVDETDIIRVFDKILGFRGQVVTRTYKANTLEAMKWYGREKIPKDAPTKWVQFKDKAYSLESGEIYDVTPDFFFTNPIPWELGESEETPIIDKLFREWVGEENKIDLYETLAYCCYREYPIQTLICLIGSGRNGKSCFLRVLVQFLGSFNTTSTELDLLTGINKNRFETHKLYKKLVCIMGETNFNTIGSSSLIKKITGGDMIGFEKKCKDPFDDYTYAKLIIASNSLPTTTDTSDGFFRRWHIVNFPNEFPEGKDIVKDIPLQEYHNLAFKSMRILQDLLERGKFTNQKTIEQRRMQYISASNPLPVFLECCCVKQPDKFVTYNELYTAYVRYLHINKKRRVKMREFRSALEDEGLFPEKTAKKVDGDWLHGYYIDGISLKSDWESKIFDNFAFLTQFLYSSYSYRTKVGKPAKKQKSQKKMQEKDIQVWDDRELVWERCAFPVGDACCGETPGNYYDGMVYCKKHMEIVQKDWVKDFEKL